MKLEIKALAVGLLLLQAVPCLAEFEIDEAADLTGTGLFLPPGALDALDPSAPPQAAGGGTTRRGIRFPGRQGAHLPELSGLSVAVGAAVGVLADEAIRHEVFPKLARATATHVELEVARAQRLVRRLRRGRPRPTPVVEEAPVPEPNHSGGRFAGFVALGFASFLLMRRRAGGAKSVEPAADAVTTPVAKRPKSKAAPPPPPPRGKGAPKVASRPKAATADEAFLSPRSAELARFGKRIHWVKPSCEEPQQDTIFGELKMVHTQSEQERKLQFDKNLMDAMFTPRSARGTATTPRKSWTGPKPQGLCLLDNSRAHNVAIVLTKLAMSTKELSQAVRLFDTGSSWLRADHVELLTVAMPSTSEATKLLAHKDKEESLRDVERRMLPLCDLSPARMKVMKFALSYQALRENLLERCKVLQLAAEESRNSVPFRELLAIVLEAGNYINGGDQANAQGERVRAFGIESLQSLANFKVGCISCMHFLCITMRASDRRFLSCLEDSLKHVRAASKERFNQLRSDVEAFLGEVNFAAARLREMTAAPEEKAPRKLPEVLSPKGGSGKEAGDEEELSKAEAKEQSAEPAPWPVMTEEDLARERLSMIVSDCAWKANQLRMDLSRTEQASADLQTYFSVASPRKDQVQEQCSTPKANKPHHRVPPEQFFGYIAGFLDMVKGSWNEIDSNPSRWRQFFNSADGCKGSGAESFARHVSESHMEPGKDGDLSPRKRCSGSEQPSALLPSPRRFVPREVQDSPKVGPISPRLATLQEAPEAATAPWSPRRTAPLESPRIPEASTVPEDKEAPGSPRRRRRGGLTPRSNAEETAETPRAPASGATTPRVWPPPSEDVVNHGSPPAKVPPKVPKLNLKRQSPRAVTRKWSDLPDTDRSLKGFITAMGSPVNKAQQSPQHASRDPLSTSSSSASVLGDKAFAEDSASSSTETDGEVEGRAPGLHEPGYASTSASSDTGLNGLESPASASSPNFAPIPSTMTLGKVPPLKMSKIFGPRGVTPSFGPGVSASIPEKAAEIKKGPETSPRRLLSARSGEDTGTARKMASNRSQKAGETIEEPAEKPPETPQTCEFHQMNDSTDCEYHKLADSDTDMTQSDEEFELRRNSASSAA